MNNEKRNEEILRLRNELSTRYSYIMGVILFMYTLIFLFFFKDNLIAYYCLIGAVFMSIYKIALNLFFPSATLENDIRGYLIFAPLYMAAIILYFWKYTIIGFCWLIPIPFGAYVFLGKTEGLFFSVYTLIISAALFIIPVFFPLDFINISFEKIRYTDFLSIILNIIIILFLIYYKDKIREQEFLAAIEKIEDITLPIRLDEKEVSEADQVLFEKIENEMILNLPYTNPEFNISMLSIILKVSNNYISRAIRFQGYSNFNNYVNSHRISYVKKLIDENDLNKITLMYIYSEAGFTSQSTFNRVFKQLENMTPSEYIQNINRNNI